MILPKTEQETYIYLSPMEKEACVCTSDPVWVRKMEKLIERRPDVFKCTKQSEEYSEYTCPKKCVKVHAPQKARELTDEQRAAYAERMKALRAKQLEERGA